MSVHPPNARIGSMNSSARRLLLVLSSSCAMIAAAAGPAAAAPPDPSGAQSCPSPAVSQAFAPWGDSSWYALVPGGDFESSDWGLDQGAQLVSGSEPFAVTGVLGASSLSLPAGASAQSPSTCVDAGYPTMRFFTAGSGTVLVQVVYAGLNIPVGMIRAGGAWAPSRVLQTGSAIWGALSGGSAEVSLRFTGLSGDPQIDDVLIDPWNRG
jgi:hypothetical protein